MARGYLGKISAVISANTGQFRRGVNEAAQETRNFARSVEQTLRRASSDATKSLQSILTPIQQVQASLRAAGEQGLRFRGFQGAIRDVNELKQRLTSLSDQDVRLVLQISGAERITDLQQQLRAINDRDIRIVTRVGGVDGLQAGVDRLNAARDELVNDSGFQVLQGRISGVATRLAELRENSQLQLSLAGTGGDLSEVRQLRAEYDLLSQSLTELEQERRRFVSQRIGVNIDFTELEDLTSRLRGVNVAAIPGLMEGLEQSQFQQAEASMLRLVTVAEGLQKPLAESVSEFSKLDLAVQAGFLPSMSQVQNEVQDLARTARDTGDGFEDSFNRIEARADSVITSIRQMSELAKEIATLRTGDELVFQQPQLMGALGRGREFGNQAATRIEQAGPQVRQETVERLRQILALSQDIERQFAVLQNARQGGRDFIAGDIEATIRAQAAEIDRLVDEGRTALNITADTSEATTRVDTLAARIDALRENARFVITGEISANQVVDTLGQINSLLERAKTAGLGASAFQSRVDSLFSDANAASRGDQDALQRFRATFESLRNSIQEGLELQVNDKKAQDAVNSLTASLDKLRQNADFVITGRAQNLDQVQSEVGRIIGSISGLDDAERGALEVRIKAVLDAAGRRDLDNAADELQQLKTASDDAIRVKLDAKTAKTEADQLSASVEKLRQNAEFAITGRAQNFDQVQSELNKIIGGLSKVEQSQRDVLRVDISAALDAIDDGNLTDAIAALERVRQLRDTIGGSTAASTGGLDFGLDLDDPQRQIEVIRSSINSLKGQLDTLPASVRSQFIPALQAAQNRLQALANSPNATADAIEDAANEVDRLNRQYRQVSQVQALPNFAQALDDSAIRGSIGSLNALQQILSRVGAEAGSNAAVQFDRMRAAIQRATTDGTIGSQAFQNELREIARDASVAAAETGRIGQGAAFREIQRGGDIARGGFDRLSLATQQAAFALDDFFSVQGDFSQRIRAVQNNITQLAFILGGTPALFVAIGTAIAAQAAVGLVRWYNEGRTAEDQTRALNDALARQKSLVEELAQAFESLGDSIARRAFSDSAQQARAFGKEIDDIVKKQKELRESNVIDLDPEVQRERANQNALRRELESETDIGRRTAIEAQIKASRDRERQLAETALQNRPSAQEVVGAIEQARRVVEFDRARRTSANPVEFTPEARERRRLAAVAGIDVNAAAADTENLLAQRRALQRQVADLTEDATRRDVGGKASGPENERAAAERNRLEGILASIELPLVKALDDSAIKIFEAGNLSARRIEEAQKSVADAIEAGVPGARAVERRLNSLGNQLQQAFDDLEEARAADPSERASLQANAQSRIDRIRRQQVAELAAADSLRRENTLNPERQVGNVISRIESAISSIGAPAAGIQGRLRELQFERESIRQQRAGIGNNPFAARRLDNQEQALTLAIRSLEDEVNVLSEAFNGFNREVDNRLRPQGDATRGLDRFETPGERARRELEQTLADIAAAAEALEERVLAGIAPNGIPLRDITDEERNRLAEIERRRQQADDQARGEQMRANAPAIFGLADSVANAVLQGPSRAALNVSDISTQEGARELNRLLRGEDSNRDNQNLVELQRQSTILEEMLRDNKNGWNNVAAAR